MRQIFIIGIVLAIWADVGFSQASVTFLNQSESSTAWNGFGSDFSPSWVGQNTVVQLTEDKKALDGIFASGCCINMSGTLSIGGFGLLDMNQKRWTVEKISSSAYAATDVDSNFLLGNKPFAASWDDRDSGNDSNYSSLANYANIVTSDNRVLANASAIAYQNAHFNGQSFGATGKVAATTILKNGSASAQSSAKGSSCFTASYKLEKDTPFSFSLDFAATDVDLSFSAVDILSGKELWDLTPSNSGALEHLEWSGILGAGQYSFALDALTSSLIDQKGVQKIGGQAVYDISFNFAAESYTVPNFTLGVPMASTPNGIILGSGSCLNGSSGSTPSTTSVLGSVMTLHYLDGAYPAIAELSVPEPNLLVMLFAGFFSYAVFRRRKQ
jgi:hypothetical protein